MTKLFPNTSSEESQNQLEESTQQLDPDLKAYLENNFDQVFHLYRETMEAWEKLPNTPNKNRLVQHTFRNLFGKTLKGPDSFWQLAAVEKLFQDFGSRIENAFVMEKLLSEKYNFQKTLPNLETQKTAKPVLHIINTTKKAIVDTKRAPSSKEDKAPDISEWLIKNAE